MHADYTRRNRTGWRSEEMHERNGKNRRVGFVLKVKQELIDEYKRRHEEVWPDMLNTLTDRVAQLLPVHAR